MSAHSTLAPSAAHRWRYCVAAPAATAHVGDTSSEFAREGSAAHVLGERALGYERQAEFWIGETISISYEEDGIQKTQDFVVDQEMADHVQVYVDAIRTQPGELLVEEQFDLTEVYGVPEQSGTGDAVLLDYERMNIYVGDLKFGRGVQVFAEGNDQLISYGCGALKNYDMLGDWETVTVAIHQPRLNHYDEHTYTVEELEAWMDATKGQAQVAMSLIGEPFDIIENHKNAGEKQCQWCPIKGKCQTLAKFVHDSVFEDFVTLDAEPSQPRDSVGLSDELLGKLMARADLIASTSSAWRAEGHRRVSAGIKIPGWKMVAGKKGRRMWSDEEAAKKIMKGARMKNDEMYKQTLLTYPATETKLKKAKPKVWAKLKALMTQSDGKPSLEQASDPRPELAVAESESFKDVTESDGSEFL